MASRDNPDFLSAESLMDDKVINTEGEDLGKFNDLMIDLEEGKIAYAALSFGGTLGMGNKLFAIPWKALTLRVHEHAFVLDIPKEVLKKAEGFDKDNWPATSRESLTTMYSYYGYQPYWERETEEGIQLPGHAVSEPTTRTSTSAGLASGFLRASKIRGEKVFNRDGDHIGKIEDIMSDLQDGRIAYAVISHGGILGLGSKHIPIPWQALSLRSRDNAFVVDLPKEALDKAEGLDKDKWPVTREELSKTFSYYKYQPYWQTGAAAGIAGAAAATTMREREATPEITRTETTTRMEPEREVRTETVVEETVIEETIRTEETSEARAERERLEALKVEEERKLSELERQRMEATTQLETERERLDRLERERIEAERQARIERERLAQLERELEEARRREETEKVTRIEEELRGVRLQEETLRERLGQLEKQQKEAQMQSETEREELSRLEAERAEIEQRERTERERMADLEKQRTEAERLAEEQRQRLADLERQRMEAEQQTETEKGTLEKLERECMEAEQRERTERERMADLEKQRMEAERLADTEREKLTQLEKYRMERERLAQGERERLARLEEERRMEAQPAVAMGTMMEREVPEFLSAGTIKSDRVVNSAGEDLGRIEELMIDLESQRVAYAVLSFGGFLGMADKLFAIPMQALTLRPHEHAFTLDIPKEVLERAEGFDKDHWPLTREELSRSYTYFGYQPYWQAGGMRETEVSIGMPRETERGTEPRRSIVKEKEKEGRLKTAEELIAEQEKERLEQMESKETDQEKIDQLEREKQIAERREHKYDTKRV